MRDNEEIDQRKSKEMCGFDVRGNFEVLARIDLW